MTAPAIPMPAVVLDSRLEETRRLGPWLEDALGSAVDADTLAGLELVLVELVTNIVRHGHAGQPGHAIELRAELGDGLVTIEIHDRGQSIPPEALQGAGDAFDFSMDDLDELPTHGMGLGLVLATVDEFDYAPGEAGNRTLVRKRVEPCRG